MEIYKDIEGYEGFYQVSNLGNVRSIRFNKIKFLIPSVNKCGYKYNCISLKNYKKNYTIHRLVAKAFITNIENKDCVNHIDGNKLNNRVENLEWVTILENNIHALKNKLKIMPKGKKHKASIPIFDTITGIIYGSISEAAEKTGYKKSTLQKYISGVNINKSTLIIYKK